MSTTYDDNDLRAALVAAAAESWGDAELLPFWFDQSQEGDFMRGQCELIANATHTNAHENAKSAVWDEIRAAVIEREGRARAFEIARNTPLPKTWEMTDALQDEIVAYGVECIRRALNELEGGS